MRISIFNTIKKSEYTKPISDQSLRELDRKLPVYSQQTSKGTKSQLDNNINRNVKLNNILHTNCILLSSRYSISSKTKME